MSVHTARRAYTPDPIGRDRGPEPEPGPYAVMATINGPRGWYDVARTATGQTVAVVPRRSEAHRIARLLSEHERREPQRPEVPSHDTTLAAVVEWDAADRELDRSRTGAGWNRIHAAEDRLREIAGRAR